MACPSESLTYLNRSKSRKITAIDLCWRRAKAIAWTIRSISRRRVHCWQIGNQIVLLEVMAVIWDARARAVVTSWKTITAPVIRPARSWIGAAESSIPDSNHVAAGYRDAPIHISPTVRVLCRAAISMGSRAVIRCFAIDDFMKASAEDGS